MTHRDLEAAVMTVFSAPRLAPVVLDTIEGLCRRPEMLFACNYSTSATFTGHPPPILITKWTQGIQHPLQPVPNMVAHSLISSFD
jgi:hypothetical protein